MLQAEARRIAHSANDSDALPLHETLKIKSARILKAPHFVQAEARDA
jgi:hypothetical protein